MSWIREGNWGAEEDTAGEEEEEGMADLMWGRRW